MSPTPVSFGLPTQPASYSWEATDEEFAARYGIPIEKILRFDLNTSPEPPEIVAGILASGVFDAPLSEYPPSDYLRLVETAAVKPAPAELAYYLPTLDVLWNAFGQDRLIYGSNWPVSERFADYATVQRIVGEYFNGKGAEVREKYFWRNAKAVYKFTRP